MVVKKLHIKNSIPTPIIFHKKRYLFLNLMKLVPFVSKGFPNRKFEPMASISPTGRPLNLLSFFLLSGLLAGSGLGTGWAQVWPNGCFTNGLTSWTSVVTSGKTATTGGVDGAGGNGDCIGNVVQVTNGTVYPGQTGPGFAPNSNGLLKIGRA